MIANATMVDAKGLNETSGLSPERVAVFICSSDSRRDILDQTLPALEMFWSDCPWPIYIGLNTIVRPLTLGSAILAPPSEWYREFATQLSQIDEEYILLALDDFLFEASINQTCLNELFLESKRLQLDYLRLVPLGRSLASRLGGKRTSHLSSEIERLPCQHPFYCALQVAIWRKSYLQRLLKYPISIWDFERRYIPHSMHACVVGSTIVSYHHVVERGRWLPDAPTRFSRVSLPVSLGTRPMWSKVRLIREVGERIKWYLYGYSNC